MRSVSSRDGDQAHLPFDPPVATRPAAPSPAPRSEGEVSLRHLLTTNSLASLGWPAGTELVLGPCRTPRRGQVVLAREGSTVSIGVFEVQLGRAAIRTDHGSVWIGRTAEFLGAVTMANAPLAGMPDV